MKNFHEYQQRVKLKLNSIGPLQYTRNADVANMTQIPEMRLYKKPYDLISSHGRSLEVCCGYTQILTTVANIKVIVIYHCPEP